jgi:Asp-tRNA(Asn)/Glu-tRNA(Gln) amidotransferase A subunit family amidase
MTERKASGLRGPERERLLAGATLRAVDDLQAVRWRLQLRDPVAAAFADIDIAVTAASLDPACRIDDEAALAANYSRQARMPFNVTGQPGLVIPAGSPQLACRCRCSSSAVHSPSQCSAASPNSTRTRPGWTKRHPAGLAD